MATISTIMLTNVNTLEKDAKISEAARILSKDRNGCIIIVENEKPVGILTTLDLVRNDITKKGSMSNAVGKIMTSPVTTMETSMKFEEALKIVDTKGFRRYPVTEQGEVAGIVTKKDIVAAVSENLKFHISIQTSVLAMFVLFELFVFFYYFLPSLM